MDKQFSRTDWPAFADQFSQDNQRRAVSLEIVGQDVGDEAIATKTPLVALDYDPQGQGAILITVGEGESTLTHTVTAPQTVWLRSDQKGKTLALEIIARDKSQTILRFEDV
jgi:hypothetical protein